MEFDSARHAAMNRLPLLMVGEFHARGFERLRVYLSLSPSGIHWRCTVGPSCVADSGAGSTLRWLGRVPPPLVARYSSAADAQYYGVNGSGFTPAQLADVFAERYPQILEHSAQPDPAYAQWYATFLELTHPNVLPYAEADFPVPTDHMDYLYLGDLRRKVVIPYPPPALDAGECVDT